MKCQFFADTRDLFKWDIAERLAADLGLDISYLAMLTKNGGGGGKKRTFDRAKEERWPGSGNKKLSEYLKPFADDLEKCCIKHIKTYFDSILGNRKFWIHEQDRCDGNHGDRNRKYFDQETRKTYFDEQAIPDEKLQDALVFFDPDTGLERKNIPQQDKHRYLYYEEVSKIYERMAESAVLMIYQHGRVGTEGPIDRRENRSDREKSEKTRSYFRSRGERLSKELRPKTGIPLISDWEICFFFLTKSSDLSARLLKALQRYYAQYVHTTFVDAIS